MITLCISGNLHRLDDFAVGFVTHIFVHASVCGIGRVRVGLPTVFIPLTGAEIVPNAVSASVARVLVFCVRSRLSACRYICIPSNLCIFTFTTFAGLVFLRAGGER